MYVCMYVYMCVCVYIYIYIHMYGRAFVAAPVEPLKSSCLPFDDIMIRPILLLTLRLLRLLDSKFPGNPLWAWEFPPITISIMLESNPLKSTMLVRG